jgi:hypothetical protein
MIAAEGKVRRSIRTRMCRQLVAFAATLALTTAFVGPAVAAEPAVPKSKAAHKTATPEPGYDRAAAKQAYEEALRAFNLGHWQDAVAGFEKSYTLSGDAALLFNVAQAQRQAGNFKEAIIAYKAFLREKPDTPHREMIEAKLKELEAGVEGKTTTAKPAGSKPQPDRLTGIWEDPFEHGKEVPAAVTATPAGSAFAQAPTAPAPALPAAGKPTTPQAVPETTSLAASALVPAPPIGQEPMPVRDTALDLSQQPANREAATGSSSRWWLWTGIGAVVAAGVVTAVILSTRGPERDTSCPSGVNGCLPVEK